jgi:hypothetical protein
VANFIGAVIWIIIGLALVYTLFYYHPVIAFSLLAVAVYWIVLKTGLADNVVRNNKERAREEAATRDHNAIASEWKTADFVLPTREEFVKRIRSESSGTRLRPEVLRPILTHIGWLYEHSGLDQTHLSIADTKDALLGLCNASRDAIRAFAKEAPLQLQEPNVAGSALFEAKRTLAQLVGDDPATALERAYTVLAKGFGTRQRRWREQNLMDVYCGPVDLKDKPPDRDTYIDIHIPPGDDWTQAQMEKVKKAWDREQQQYEKRVAQRNEKLPPLQRAFLGTPFWNAAGYILPDDAEFTDPVVIPEKERFAGTWIIAPSGQGKTNLMWHLIDQDRTRGTVVIMDSKGELLNSYSGYPNAVLIDPQRVRINPFRVRGNDDPERAIMFVEYVFKLFAVDLTEKQRALFYPCMRLIAHHPDGSIQLFKRLLLQGWQKLDMYHHIKRCDQNTQQFFLLKNQDGTASFDRRDNAETREQIGWRLDSLLSRPAMQQMFDATETNVPFYDLMESRKIILINNNKVDLGDAGCEFFGRFFLGLIRMAALQRTKPNFPEQRKVPVYVYIDEAQTVIANDTEVPVILDECRSQKIALTLAHQRLSRITSNDVKDALFNCPVRFASVANDAPAIAHHFPGLTAQQLQLKPHRFAFIARAEGMDKAITFDVPFFDTSKFPPYVPPPEPGPEPEVAAAAPKPKPEPAPEPQVRKKGR